MRLNSDLLDIISCFVTAVAAGRNLLSLKYLNLKRTQHRISDVIHLLWSLEEACDVRSKLMQTSCTASKIWRRYPARHRSDKWQILTNKWFSFENSNFPHFFRISCCYWIDVGLFEHLPNVVDLFCLFGTSCDCRISNGCV